MRQEQVLVRDRFPNLVETQRVAVRQRCVTEDAIRRNMIATIAQCRDKTVSIILEQVPLVPVQMVNR
jgi:hypothetical protein